MKPISLTLRGFKGIKAGMGLDEIKIDFSGMSGIVAITGPNGMGKSTILDSLTPYRIMPYKCRKSADWSPNSFSYYDQCYGEAMKEFVFAMGGVTYKSIILIDADRRKQEAYLYREASPVWVPLNDGKTRTYDEAVEKVCGSPSLFFTSVFRAQGARNLSDIRRSEIMGLFSELLNVDHIKLQGDKCRQVVSALSGKLDIVRAQIATADAEMQSVIAFQNEISVHDADIAATHLVLDEAKKDLEAIRLDLSAMRERKASQESERSVKALLMENLVAAREGMAATAAKAQKEIAAIDAKIAAATSGIEKARVELSGKVARAGKIASGSEAIRDAVAKEAMLIETLESRKLKLADAQTLLADAMRLLATKEVKFARVQDALANLEATAKKLDGVNCGPAGINSECRFIADAVKAQESIPSVQEQRNHAMQTTCDLRRTVDQYREEVALAEDAVKRGEADLSECMKFTRLLPELELAETSMKEWSEELASREKAFADEMSALDGEKWYAESSLDVDLSKFKRDIEELQQKIASCPVPADVDAEIKAATIKEGVLLSAVEGCEKKIRETELLASGLKAKLEIIRERVSAVDDLRVEEKGLSEKSATFAMLAKACSNDGIVALELDDASPQIAVIVNDLLQSCYGSRYSVRMETQAEKLDGAMKEAFDIIVMDAETGLDRSITEMSGGQVCFIEDAITRGICLFNIGRGNKEFGALFSDEKDGALSEDRKLEFMKIKRAALAAGSHEVEYFISQTADLVNMADHIIALGVNGVVVQ